MKEILKRLEYKTFKEYEKNVDKVKDYVWDYKKPNNDITQLEHNESLNSFVRHYMKEFNLDIIITSKLICDIFDNFKDFYIISEDDVYNMKKYKADFSKNFEPFFLIRENDKNLGICIRTDIRINPNNIILTNINDSNYKIIDVKNMGDLVKNYQEIWLLDETDCCIFKEQYKEEGFKKNILFKIERNELDENYFEECLNIIKPLLNHKNLIICCTPIIRYQTNCYVVCDIIDIKTIENSIKNGFIVLLYAPVFVDGELKYKTKILHQFIKITNPDINKRREVDLIPKHERTWEEKMIYLIDHSEVIDESYFKSESGETYQMGDKRINCLIKSYQSDKPIYRSGHIKLNEIGYIYKLVEDNYNEDNKIVIEEI